MARIDKVNHLDIVAQRVNHKSGVVPLDVLRSLAGLAIVDAPSLAIRRIKWYGQLITSSLKEQMKTTNMATVYQASTASRLSAAKAR